MDRYVLGNNIRRLRKDLGWTQERLGDEAGLSKATISRLESFTVSSETAGQLPAIADALRVDVETLLRPFPPATREAAILEAVERGMLEAAQQAGRGPSPKLLSPPAQQDIYSPPHADLWRWAPRVPVRTVADLARYLGNGEGDMEAPDSFVPVPAALLAGVYERILVLDIQGDELRPLAQDGDQIIVAVGARWVVGDKVVARLADGSRHFKQIKRLDDHGHALASLTGDDVLPVTEDIVIEAVAVGRVRWESWRGPQALAG